MEIEITPENVEKKFANAVDYYCIYMPNLLNFYQLFTRRVNNKIASMRICVKRDVTPVLEYNEKWVCEIDPALFNQALAIDLYRFINHHCTLRELQGANAFKASTAVCNSPELQQFLKAAPLELAEMARKLIWSREIIEEEIKEKISDEDWYYESVFEILNRKAPQQPQQNQNQDQNQSGSSDNQKQQSGSSDNEEKDDKKDGSGQNDKKDQDDKSKGSSKNDKDGDKGDKDSDSDQQDGDGDSDEKDNDQNSNGKKDKKDKSSKGKDQDEDQDSDGDEDSDDDSQGSSSDKNDQNQEGDGKGDKDDKDGDKDDSDEQDGDGDSDSKDGDSDSQDGDSDDDSDEQEGNGGKSPRDQELDDNANADPSKAPNSTGNPFKDWSSNGDENTEEWGRNQVVDQLIQEAFEHSKSSGWGSLTGEQISQIEIANRRKISITPIIASFAASVRTRKRFATRMRYNKRYGLIFPGYRLDRKSRILFAIDSSGSMSDEDINKGCAILHNFLKKCDIDVAFWDAQMVDPFKFKKNITKIDAPGRGGTDPHCIGEYLDEHQKLHYDGVILFTDCIWRWEEDNLKAPVFIISSEEKYRVPSFVKHHATIQALTHCFD